MDIDRDLPEAFISILTLQYIKWRLSLEEYDFEDCPELPHPEKLDYIMRSKCKDMESIYDGLIFDMISDLKISPQTTFPDFMDLVNKRLFDKSVDWDKIYILFAFCGKLAIDCLEKGIPQVIANVSDCLAVYIDSRLREWIEKNGGFT